MRADVGDRIAVLSRRVGQPQREAVVIAVEGKDGGPPYRVRWEDSGQEALYFPGPDSIVKHPSEAPAS
jgi:hypothetical protein